MTCPLTHWKALSALLRCRLSLMVASTALMGFVYECHDFNVRSLYVFAGVFLCSAAASAINQVQEKDIDGLMERTRRRAVPSGLIAPNRALLAALATGGAGLAIIFLKTTALAAGLAAFTMVWYNCVYTPLKRTTGYAVLMGALAGALPPLIGYCAAGGRIADRFIVVCVFMYLWQVAHFLLLLFKFGKEYEQAGIPSIDFVLNADQFRSLFFIWILATAGSTLLFPLFHIIFNAVLIAILIFGNCLFVAYFGLTVIRSRNAFDCTPAFRGMYAFQGFILALLIANAVVN